MPDEPFTDPYTYPGTAVLRNKLGIKEQAQLEKAEYRLTWARRQQLHRQPPAGSYDLSHLRAIHRHLFQDIFEWAGDLRTVNITKGSSQFHPAGRLEEAAAHTFNWLHQSSLMSQDLDDNRFVTLASELLNYVNYMHPFREGNGRAQRAFLDQVAAISGRVLSWRNVGADEHTRASIDSFEAASGAPFERILAKVCLPARDGLSLLDDGLYQVSALPITVGRPPRAASPVPPLLRRSFGDCGATTTRGTSCRRRGRCPYHHGA